MSSLTFKIISYLFHFLCFLVTLYFISTCVFEFYLNEDVSKINFQSFHASEEDIYPSMTLCFLPRFDNEVLKKNGINSSVDYAKFLSGDYFEDKMTNIDYDNITIDFKDFLLGIGMVIRDNGVYGSDSHFFYDHRAVTQMPNTDTNGSESNSSDWTPNFYTSCRRSTQKCFTIDVPYLQGKTVMSFGVVFDSSIFPYGIRPKFDEFGVEMHYPGQFYSTTPNKYSWKDLMKNDSLYITMRFDIKNIQVMRYRNNGKNSCNKKWKMNDEKIMLEAVNRARCMPSHWKIYSGMPICKSAAKMKFIYESNSNEYEKPCQNIQTLSFVYEEHEYLHFGNREWNYETDRISEVGFYFKDYTYMKIQQFRAYSVKDVVGDIGGYLGLFLGFSVLQLQGLFTQLIQWIKKIDLKKRAAATNDSFIDVSNEFKENILVIDEEKSSI